jgi:hypothetical protein
MDRPDGTIPISPEFAKLPWLDYKGHRRKGHDPLTAGIIGFQEAGLQGIAAAEIHIASDMISDLIRKKASTGVRDLIEAGGNLAYDHAKEQTKKKRKSRKRST